MKDEGERTPLEILKRSWRDFDEKIKLQNLLERFQQGPCIEVEEFVQMQEAERQNILKEQVPPKGNLFEMLKKRELHAKRKW